MEKTTKANKIKVLAIVLAVLLVLLLAYTIFTNITVNVDRRTDEFIYAYKDKLYVKDQVITLQGVNVGSWLVPEGWMSILQIEGQNDDVAGEKLTYLKWIDALSNNADVGNYQRALQLVDIYLENWFTKADVQFIKDMGLNCIRLPFGWFNLYNLDYSEREDGFKWLDKCLQWCEDVGIYCILDLHGVIGSQNMEHHSGDDTQCEFFDNETYQLQTIQLWQRVASRYKDNAVVAGYDIVNEPTGKDNKTTAHEWKVFDKIYEAIRQVDTNHLIIMESCWDFLNMPNPVTYSWENIMYSFHWYKPGGESLPMGLYLAYQNLCRILCSYKNVPIYIGEFALGDSYEDMAMLLDLCNKNDWSWTSWTYKTNDSWNWGLLCTWKERKSANNLTYDEIATLYADCQTNFGNQTDAYRNLTKYLSQQ